MKLYIKQSPTYDVIRDYKNQHTFTVHTFSLYDSIWETICLHCCYRTRVLIKVNSNHKIVKTYYQCSNKESMDVNRYCPGWRLKDINY